MNEYELPEMFLIFSHYFSRPERSPTALITHIMSNHNEPIGRYSLTILDTTKKLICLSKVVLAYNAMPPAESPNISISPSK